MTYNVFGGTLSLTQSLNHMLLLRYFSRKHIITEADISAL